MDEQKRARSSYELSGPLARTNKVSVELSRIRLESETSRRQLDEGAKLLSGSEPDQAQDKEKALKGWYLQHQVCAPTPWAHGAKQQQVLLDYAWHEAFSGKPPSYTACLNDVLNKVETNWQHSIGKGLMRTEQPGWCRPHRISVTDLESTNARPSGARPELR